ncbi:MAG: hypothetical protein KI792_02340 [Alphaproteobacteria bacterium]|nr:hypothetical protein [Alphaproteobacteria bacterium SS10]
MTDDPLWQMMDEFEQAFPSIWAKTWIIDPRVEEDWKAADQWVRERLRQSGMAERDIQSKSNNLFVNLRTRSPQFFGAGKHLNGVIAGVIVPVVSKRSWAERIPDAMTYMDQQKWSVPELEPFENLSRQYAVYTFDHETAHAVFHELPQADRPSARGFERYTLTKQQDETFADMAGGLGLVRHFDAEEAIDMIRRISHMRAISAINHRDTEHLTTRGLKRALTAIANPTDQVIRWQQDGMDGAKALAKDVHIYALSKQQQQAISEVFRQTVPGDTFSPERALETFSTIGGETKKSTVYELMRDYIDAIEAMVPADRYDAGQMMRAKLKLRRNPIAKGVDEAHPRVETMVAEARERVAIHKAKSLAANQLGGPPRDRAAPTL